MANRRMRYGGRISALMTLALVALMGATWAESPVADAAQRGALEEVRALLQQGQDANGAQADGMTALHWAALNGHAEIAEILVYAGATVKPTTRLGNYTPLHLASRGGHGRVVEILVGAGADANITTGTGVAPLHFAAQANSPDAVRALIAHGADVNVVDGHSARTPLMFAAALNATAALEALIEAGADTEMATTVKDFVEIAAANNEDRARRNRVRMAGLTPEETARQAPPRGGFPGPQRGAGAGAGRGAQPAQGAQAAAQLGQARQPAPDGIPMPDADEPVEEPAPEPEPDPNLPKVLSSTEQIGNQGGFTALHYAARDGQIEAAMALLHAGADIDQVTAGDETSPLLISVINGNYDLAMELIEAGADVNLASDDGAAPLFATLNIEWSLRTWYPQPGAFRTQRTSHLELMEALLVAGAEPNARTSTHIWYAAYNAGRMGVDFTGATPLWRAAYATDLNAMKLLVEYGADPNIWTINLPNNRNRNFDPDFPNRPPVEDEEEELDPSGLPPVPTGAGAIHPFHAAAGVGFGTSRVAQQHRSVPDGWLPAIKYFVEEVGVDPNLRDKDGFSAIHHAAARGDNATILYLVSMGADVTFISRRGQTTADMANSPEQRAQPHPATVALLEKLGSKNNHNCQSCGQGN